MTHQVDWYARYLRPSQSVIDEISTFATTAIDTVFEKYELLGENATETGSEAIGRRFAQVQQVSLNKKLVQAMPY